MYVNAREDTQGKSLTTLSGQGCNLLFRMADCGEADFVAVLAHGGHDIESQGECASAVFQRDYRGGSLTYGAEKGSQLSVKRFLGGDGRLGYADLRIDGGSARAVGPDGEDQHLLAPVIEGNVLPGLKETQFANPLGGDAAGGEVRDAARFKLNAHVGNVRFSGKDR